MVSKKGRHNFILLCMFVYDYFLHYQVTMHLEGVEYMLFHNLLI